MEKNEKKHLGILMVILKSYLPNISVTDVKNVSISYQDNLFLKKMFLPKKIYRKYYLKIQTDTIEEIKISYKEKKKLKQEIPEINFLLNVA